MHDALPSTLADTVEFVVKALVVVFDATTSVQPQSSARCGNCASVSFLIAYTLSYMMFFLKISREESFIKGKNKKKHLLVGGRRLDGWSTR